MADYYPLIARAIAGLDVSAPGEQRRALYERARTALIAQLRGVEPSLPESEITRERLSLEEAVRKVESEAANRARLLAKRHAAEREYEVAQIQSTEKNAEVEAIQLPKPKNALKRHAFLSYQMADKIFAAKVRGMLESQQFSTFMAHDDLKASDDWKKRILEEIKRANLFVAILSENYVKSAFCMQESGIAVFRKMVICPISIDKTISPGVMDHIQSIRVEPDLFSITDLMPSMVKFDARFAGHRKDR